MSERRCVQCGGYGGHNGGRWDSLVWVTCAACNGTGEPQEGASTAQIPSPEPKTDSAPSCDSATAADFRADPAGTLQRATGGRVEITDGDRVVGVLSVPTDSCDSPELDYGITPIGYVTREELSAMYQKSETQCCGLACEAMGHSADCPQPAPCDSELAAIRKRLVSWPYDGGWATDDVATLLRMVDELTDRVRYWQEMSTQLGIKASEYRTSRDELTADLKTTCETEAVVRQQRDELRAKLADAQYWRERHCEESRLNAERSAQHWLRIRELEAKLAEAEKKHAEDVMWIAEADARAEAAEALLTATQLQSESRGKALLAAEARVRELEMRSDRLITACQQCMRKDEK